MTKLAHVSKQDESETCLNKQSYLKQVKAVAFPTFYK